MNVLIISGAPFISAKCPWTWPCYIRIDVNHVRGKKEQDIMFYLLCVLDDTAHSSKSRRKGKALEDLHDGAAFQRDSVCEKYSTLTRTSSHKQSSYSDRQQSYTLSRLSAIGEEGLTSIDSASQVVQRRFFHRVADNLRCISVYYYALCNSSYLFIDKK